MLLVIKNISHAINSRFVRFINMSNNTLKYLFAVILPQHIESQEVLQKRQQRLTRKMVIRNVLDSIITRNNYDF